MPAKVNPYRHPTLGPIPTLESAEPDDLDTICWEIPDAAWQEFHIERALQEADSWDRK